MTLHPIDILNKLMHKEPVSIIRIGDGEGLVLNSLSSITAMQNCNERVMRRQMGYYPTLKDIEAIRDNLIDAYSHADIIGIPMHIQKTNSDWQDVVNILNANVPVHTERYCSTDIAYDMLNAGYFVDLLLNRPVLNYISCRNLDHEFKAHFNIQVVNKYQVAPEAKFVSGYDGDVHYPTQFNRVQRWMDVVGAEGNLLLVGAGVIGKIYCNWWRDRGGVAFDIGSVFDTWSGKVTRGPNRGLDKDDDDLTHKL